MEKDKIKERTKSIDAKLTVVEKSPPKAKRFVNMIVIPSS